MRDLATVAARLRRAPLHYTAPVLGRARRLTFDESALAALAYGAWQDTAVYATLPAAARAAARGETRPLLALARAAAAGTASLDDVRGRFSVAQTLATTCHDYPTPLDRTQPLAAQRTALARALRRLPRAPFAPFSPRAWSAAVQEGGGACLGWPAPSGDGPLAGGPLPDVPVLVASGDLDLNTTVEAARQLAAAFPHARMLAVPNAIHTPEDEPTGCMRAIYRRFFLTRAVGSTACMERIPPVRVR